MKHSKECTYSKITLIMTVIIVLLTIVLVGITCFNGLTIDYNIIESSVSVLSIAVALIIGYQIINVLEIKSEMKIQNDRIEKSNEEIRTTIDNKIKEVDDRMKEVDKELLFQKNRVDDQLLSIAKQKIVINQLLAKRSIQKPHEYWQAMSYQEEAISTAILFNMIESTELCTELFENAFYAYSIVWETDSSKYEEKRNDLRKKVEESPNRPFLFLLDIVDEALLLARKTYTIDMREISEDEKSKLEFEFNKLLSIVKTGWRTNMC